MNNLRDYVNWKLTHADKTTKAEGYPLTMENCKANKRMKQLEIYGNSVRDGTPTPEAPIEVQSVGELVTDVNDANYGKYKIPIVTRGINLFNRDTWNAPIQTINGITFTPLDDERIHIKGKAENTSSAVSYQKLIYESRRTHIKPGIYRYKPCKYSGNSGFTLQFGISNGTKAVNINSAYSGTEVKFDNAYINYVQFYFSGSALQKEYDDIIELQLVSGTQNLPYEPYIEPVTTNIFLKEPLRKIGDYADCVDFKNKKAIHYVDGTTTEEPITCELPKLTAKTSIIEVDTSILPSNAKGKYIKR